MSSASSPCSSSAILENKDPLRDGLKRLFLDSHNHVAACSYIQLSPVF